MADGFLKRLVRGRRRAEPVRETTPFPTFFQIGQNRPGQKIVWKPTPRNLRYFSKSPYARRAINAIKNPIAQLEWEIVPRPGIKETPELKRQIETATYCLANPNRDDSFRTLAEQVIEDVLIGAGAIEVRTSGDKARPLWLYPVDGLSIQIYPGWAGGKDEARYTQTVGSGTYAGGGTLVQLRDDELIYIRPNPSTATPFGLGPLEVAFTSISRQLGVGEFAGNVATNARPSVLLDLGEGVNPEQLAAYRSYWQSEIEGQGKMPIVSTKGGEVQKLFPDGDNALFLKWQEFLKTEIAIAFDLAPMNLGVERDVNRSTAEVGEARDWDHAIVPRASELASYLTKHALHRAMGFHLLEFRFIGLQREDRKLDAEVYEIEYKNGAATPDEYRERTGRAPLGTSWSKLTGVDRDMAKAAATGAKRVLDPDLPEDKQAPTAPKE